MESTLKRHSKHLPLRKRGIEGDLSLLITVKKDTPVAKRLTVSKTLIS